MKNFFIRKIEQILIFVTLAFAICISDARSDTKEEFIATNRQSHDEIVATLSVMHRAFIEYMSDNGGSWPQFVPKEGEAFLEEYTQFWITSLNDYGVPKEAWFHGNGTRFTYIPTLFENSPLSAFKYSTQPWVVTQGIHSGKTYILLPDGQIIILPFDSEVIPNGPNAKRDKVTPTQIPDSLKKFSLKKKTSVETHKR